MIEKDSKIRKFLGSLFLVIGFTGFIFLTFWLSWTYFEKRTEEDVSSQNPEYFPIVAIQPEKVEVIKLPEFEEYKKNNPNVSFLIPLGKESQVNQQLQQWATKRGAKNSREIRVIQNFEGKQIIEYEAFGDGFYLSRYEAKDKTVKPLVFKIAGPGFVFFPCGTTFLIGLMGFFILRAVLWFLKKQQKKL